MGKKHLLYKHEALSSDPSTHVRRHVLASQEPDSPEQQASGLVRDLCLRSKAENNLPK